ncbi:hypothetical protein FRC20_008790, partial [Serendipita sp. 405]
YYIEGSGGRVNGNLDEEFIDGESLQQLLEQIHVVDGLASDVESKVDMLFENLEQSVTRFTDEKQGPKDQPA